MQDGVSEACRVELGRLMDEMNRVQGRGREYGLLALQIVTGLRDHDYSLARAAIERLRPPNRFESALSLYTHTGSEEDRILSERSAALVSQDDAAGAKSSLEVHTLCWKGEIEAAVRAAEEVDDEDLVETLIEDVKEYARKSRPLYERYENAVRHRSAPFEFDDLDDEGGEGFSGPVSEPERAPSLRIRAQSSVERFHRLVELDAPHKVIRSEALLLLKFGEFGTAQKGLDLVQEQKPYGEEILGHIALGFINTGKVEKGKVLFKRLTDPLMRAEIMLTFLLRRLQAARTLAS